MLFTSIPDNYAPINKPLLYGFSFEVVRDVVDVKIVDIAHNRTLGARRFYDVQSGQIDIAPYLKRSFEPRPVDGFINVVDAEGFYSVIAVEVDGERSPQRYFSPYPVCDGEATLFRSATKQQTLSHTESDYIVIYAPRGGSVGMEFYVEEWLDSQLNMEIKPNDGLQILKVEASICNLPVNEIVVNINLDGIDDYLTYRIEPKSELSRRLMWCDKDGTIQFYTFPTCRTRHSVVEKQRINSEQGLRVVDCQTENVLSLISDYETVAEIERLGGILESGFVWLDKGVSSVRVDVVSTESVVRYGGALNSLRVDIRSCDREGGRL